MKQFEKIQKEIVGFEDAMEIAGYLNGINAAAIVYCSHNYPNEVCIYKSGESEITIYGMAHFLESEV